MFSCYETVIFINYFKMIYKFFINTVLHTDVLNKEFNRNGMSYISYNALFFKNIKTGEFLIDKLI